MLIGTLLLLVYRSLTALLLGFLPVVCGALAGLTAVALTFNVVYGITLGFGITLIGEAVDYSVYLFVQAERQNAGSELAHRSCPQRFQVLRNWVCTRLPALSLPRW